MNNAIKAVIITAAIIAVAACNKGKDTAAQTAQEQTQIAELNGMPETPQAAEGKAWTVAWLDYRIMEQVIESVTGDELISSVMDLDDLTAGRWGRYDYDYKYQLTIEHGYFYTGGHDVFKIVSGDITADDWYHIDRAMGAFAYMKRVTHTYWAETDKYKNLVDAEAEKNMAQKYDQILNAIVSKGRITRDEVTAFYQENIKDLAARVVEARLGDRYLGGPDGEILKSTVPLSDRNSLAEDIAGFLLKPSDNVFANLFGEGGKKRNSVSGTEFLVVLGYFNLLSREFQIVTSTRPKSWTVLEKYNGDTRNVTIPAGVETIGIEAFIKNAAITSVTIPDSVRFIEGGAFAHCSSLASVTMPDSVIDIEIAAFANCYSLTSVTIGSGVTSIGEMAFQSCVSLERVTIGSGVTAIGERAFYHCTSLTSVTIPASVTSIKSYAFGDCTSLTSVTFQGTIPSSGLDIGAFGYPGDAGYGDLRDKYLAAGAGTYTRASGGETWTKR